MSLGGARYFLKTGDGEREVTELVTEGLGEKGVAGVAVDDELAKLRADNARLHAEVKRLNEWSISAMNVRDDLLVEIGRLRELIWSANKESFSCPWCLSPNDSEHIKCPAFSPNGTVK